MEAIDHVAGANGQTNIDNLFLTEMLSERPVGRIIDWLKTRRFLRVTNDRGFLGAVEAIRQRVTSQMAHLFFRKTKPSTKGYVRRNSVETVVYRRCRQVGQFTVLRCECRILAIDGLQQVRHRC